MNSWLYAVVSFSFLLMPPAIVAQDTAFPPASEQIPGPGCAGISEWNSQQALRACSSAESNAWLADVRHWRMERRIRAGYFDSEYERPELQWTNWNGSAYD